MVAHSNLESVIKDIKRAKNSLNFWHNFALNFKDETFVKFITIKSEHDNKEFIQSKLHEILKMILNFLKENLSSKGNDIF